MDQKTSLFAMSHRRESLHHRFIPLSSFFASTPDTRHQQSMYAATLCSDGAYPFSYHSSAELRLHSCLDAALPNGFDECAVVPVRLVGVLDGEFGDGVVEDLAGAHVARDHGGVA